MKWLALVVGLALAGCKTPPAKLSVGPASTTSAGSSSAPLRPSGASAPAPSTSAGLAQMQPPGENPALGTWRVVGCATSPGDPAACAKGTLVFERDRWSVKLPCCERASPYRVVATAPGKVTLDSQGEVTELTIAPDGSASWRPGGLGGRVGSLRFVRADDAGAR